MAQAGIVVTKENRKRIDTVIHGLMGVEYKDCPLTWKKLKQKILTTDEKRRGFIRRLKSELALSQLG